MENKEQNWTASFSDGGRLTPASFGALQNSHIAAVFTTDLEKELYCEMATFAAVIIISAKQDKRGLWWWGSANETECAM